jgi:hypothetical protein
MEETVMKISKNFYLIIALISFNGCFGMDQYQLSREDHTSLDTRATKTTPNQRQQSKNKALMVLKYEKRLRMYQDAPEEAHAPKTTGEVQRINRLKSRFTPLDWEVYKELKAQIPEQHFIRR